MAAYDFLLPVRLNKCEAPPPSPSIEPLTPTSSELQATQAQFSSNKKTRNTVGSRGPVTGDNKVITPCRRIQATALRVPLKMSQTELV